MRKILSLLFFAICVLSCNNEAKDEANIMLDKASAQMKEKKYNEALITIDSLRKIYPNAVETRKKALALYQNISLVQAQEDLAKTDSLLQVVNNDYNYQRTKVEKDKQELRATAQEIQMLTTTKIKLDSLRVRFDVQCAKIKYIHKKQKEE